MQDSEILPRLMYRAKSVLYNRFSVYNYVQHEGSFTNTTDSGTRIRYFESIISVDRSLERFVNGIGSDDKRLCDTVALKREGLHQILFNHLVFFKYNSRDLRKILNILHKAGYYPLKYKASGKMMVVKFGLNRFPILTKKLVDRVRK